MKTILHKAETRGQADYGWLITNYTFSFADYYNPNRIHFGALRVLNDDEIKGGRGFGRHPHDNMEIVTILLEGELEHKDSMNHTQVLRKDEVQAMSAGTGIFHSEYNNHPQNPLKLLQIWILPKERNITPRYDQKQFTAENRVNQWQLLVSPYKTGALSLNQDTWFSRITLLQNGTIAYHSHSASHGIYLFLIEGNTQLDAVTLNRRDGLGIWDAPEITLKALINSDILLIEIPMSIH